VAFGRTGNENFTKKLSKGSKRIAVRQALSMQNKDKKVFVVDTFACPNGKVKETVEFFNKNKLDVNKNTLLVVSVKDDLVLRATSNVPTLKVVRPTYLNVFDIMNADQIVISEKSLPMIDAWLMGEEK
jgi:large subunit ribosomal protein L4